MQTTQISRVANMLGALSLAIVDDLQIISRDAALLAVDSHPGRTVAHLSRALGRSHSATVRLVDGLVADDLISRVRGTDDRSVSISLTDAGLDEADHLRRRRAALLEQVVGDLNPQEREALEPVLEKLLTVSVRDAVARWRICRLCAEHSCEINRPCPVDTATHKDEEEP